VEDSSKAKDTIVDWKVDTQKLGQEFFINYPPETLAVTAKERTHINLHNEIKQIFDLADDEAFEDGIESLFSRTLVSFIEKYGKEAIQSLSPLFINEQINPAIIAEALRWIGRMEHLPTYSDRLLLLEQCLFYSSPYVRDGAALGIASMNEPHAIPSLRLAIKKESISELREDMKELLMKIESIIV